MPLHFKGLKISVAYVYYRFAEFWADKRELYLNVIHLVI